MRIALLSFYSGQIDRGVEIATSALAKGLSKTHEVTVFQVGKRVTPNISSVVIPIKINWQIEDASGTSSRKFYLDYWSRKIAEFTLKFLPYYFKNRYDLIIPTNGGWQVLICRLASWWFGNKIIVQGNAGIGYDDKFQLYCFPDHYVAISPQGLLWAKGFAKWVKKTYIPYGVDIEAFKKAKPIFLNLDRPIVLCVAAFSPYKRIDLLIKAMVYVKEASLLVIGQGILEEKLRELGQKLLGGRFLLKTKVNHSELQRYYKSADLFSLPSESSEAFGIVYVEAMAAGLPIVAPDDYNRRQIVGEAGIFVDPENAEKYASAIRNALHKDFGSEPEKQAEKFAWENIVGQYENLLKSL